MSLAPDPGKRARAMVESPYRDANAQPLGFPMLSFRLLAIDIDGTLLNSKFAISDADLKALQTAHEAGAEILLCTGRRHSFAMPIARLLGFDLWICSSNGAVTRSTRGEDFHRQLLPAAIAGELCRHMVEFRGSTVLTFDQEGKGSLAVEGLAELSESVARWVEHNRQEIEQVVPLEGALWRDPLQAMFCGTVERMAAAERRLKTFPRRDELTLLKTQYDDRDLCLWDVLGAHTSKGHAMERWAESRGIRREQIMAIGDNHNDIEMLERAGIPVIMGNAAAELKQFGWIETASNDENGIAQALERVAQQGERVPARR